ncbi:MAG: hypothetical protein AB7U61_05515 [Methylocystis sp.]
MNRTIRRYGWLLALLLLTLGAAGIWSVAATHEISIMASEIQSRINSRLPKEIALTGPARAIVQSVIIRSATVDLKDGKAALAVGLQGLLRTGKSFEIEANALGVPKYAGGALYFEPEKVDIRRLAYEGASATDLADRIAGGHLGNEKLRAVIKEKARKLDDWAARAATAALRNLLEERPVYRLKDDAKGAVMKAALEKVTVEDGRLDLTFSLWRLTMAAAGGFVSLVMGIILSILVIRMVLIGGDFELSDI